MPSQSGPLINAAVLVAISAAWAAGYLFGAARHLPVSATAIMTVIAATVIVPGIQYVTVIIS